MRSRSRPDSGGPWARLRSPSPGRSVAAPRPRSVSVSPGGVCPRGGLGLDGGAPSRSHSPPRERMAARPPRRRGGSSVREMPSRSGSQIRSSGPPSGGISGPNEPSSGAGGAGSSRPGGAGERPRPRPRPLLGSRPGDGPAPGSRVLRSVRSLGSGSAGNWLRGRPWSGPSVSPGRDGLRGRWVRLGGRSGSNGSTNPNGSSILCSWTSSGPPNDSPSKPTSGPWPDRSSSELRRSKSSSQPPSSVTGQAGAADDSGSCRISDGSSANGSRGCSGGGPDSSGGSSRGSAGSTKPSPNRRAGGSERSFRPRIDRSGRSRSRPRSRSRSRSRWGSRPRSRGRSSIRGGADGGKPGGRLIGSGGGPRAGPGPGPRAGPGPGGRRRSSRPRPRSRSRPRSRLRSRSPASDTSGPGGIRSKYWGSMSETCKKPLRPTEKSTNAAWMAGSMLTTFPL
jgi:hypothetical protein